MIETGGDGQVPVAILKLNAAELMRPDTSGAARAMLKIEALL